MLKKRRALTALGVMVMAFSSLSANSVKPNGCKGPNLCTSYPVLDSCGWQFDVGLLYQQMRISDAEIATAVVEKSPTTIPIVSGDFVNFTNTNVRYEFDPDAGLRIGAGYYFEKDDWLLTANFEWLRSQSTFVTDVDVPVIYQPSGYPAVFATAGAEGVVQFQEVDATMNVDYFLLDVVLAKGSYFSGCFTFEPFGGIQSSWISYKSDARFNNDAGNTNNVDNNNDGWLASSQTWCALANVDFWGVGPEVGLNSSYYMFGGWSIYSTLNVAILFGETTLTDKNGIITIPSEPTFNHTFDQNNVLTPTTRAILGLQYDRDTYCDRQHFRLRAGFDARYYFNQYPVVTYETQFLNNRIVQPRDGTIGTVEQYMRTAPQIDENNSFGMVGLILDVAYDF